MGFYIHSCPKMRYKSEYKPSELLCPTLLTWHKLDSSLQFLDKHRFTPLDPALADERSLIASSESIDTSCEVEEQVVSLLKGCTSTPKESRVCSLHGNLNHFAPRFNVISRESLAQIRLDLGTGNLLFVHQLNGQGQEVIEKMLQELGACCGEAILNRFLVQLR